MSGDRHEPAPAAGPVLTCPSAQPDMEGARVFGVIGGTVQEPRVSYLRADALVTRAMLASVAPADPTRVFRFAAPCEEARCVHFDGSRCQLAGRIVEKLDPVVDALPPCLIRPTCRWYAEQGGAACHRCPQVVTMIPKAEDRLNEAARPPAPDAAAG
jgi:hypothetical protein